MTDEDLVAEDYRARLTAVLAGAQAGGVTQAALARAAGVRQPTVSQWTSGQRLPSLTTLARLVAALEALGVEGARERLALPDLAELRAQWEALALAQHGGP